MTVLYNAALLGDQGEGCIGLPVAVETMARVVSRLAATWAVHPSRRVPDASGVGRRVAGVVAGFRPVVLRHNGPGAIVGTFCTGGRGKGWARTLYFDT